MYKRSLVCALCILLPVAASAVPIEIELIGDTTASSTSGSLGVDCTSRGTCRTQVIGTLSADMNRDLITSVTGNALDGGFDFSASTSSFHITSLFGSFHFSQVNWYSGYFSSWGGNWNGCSSWLGCKLLWLSLRGDIQPSPIEEIPEPSAALLFGAGAFLVSRRVSRRR